MFALLIITGCQGCGGCHGDLSDDNSNDPMDTAVLDSGIVDSAQPVDTAELLPCAVPEIEPNNTPGTAQVLPMEEWACGGLYEEGDFDTFQFDLETSGWVKVWARGADIGSSANLQITLDDASYDYTTLAAASPDSPDPVLLFPAEAPNRFYVTVSDQWYGHGEDYVWELLVSEAKQPLLWEANEAEPNDGKQDGTPIYDGDRIYGVIETGSDADWYVFDMPDTQTTLTATIEAWNYGSPLSAQVGLYSPDNTLISLQMRGEDTLDLDPLMVETLNAAGEWGLKITPENDTGGGVTYWYVLEVSLDTEVSAP